MEGTYICKKRIVKDGVLVCFEGQKMTMDEARSLGLVAAPKKPAAKKATGQKPGNPAATEGEAE